MNNNILFISLFFIITGCTPDRIKMTESFPAHSNHVEIYDKIIPDGVKYTVIGTFYLEKNWYGSQEGMNRNIEAEAQMHGANGAQIIEKGTTMGTWSWAAPYVRGNFLNITEIKVDKLNSVNDRLRLLDKLKSDKLISESEYSKKRAEILNGL